MLIHAADVKSAYLQTSSTFDNELCKLAYMETIGDRISKQRKRLKLSQQKLGNLVGVTRAAVSQWESGSTKEITHKHIKGLSNALGISTEELETGKPPKNGSENSEPEIAVVKTKASSLMSSASPRSKQNLERIIKAASDGRLSEEDISLLNAIAERIAKKE